MKHADTKHFLGKLRQGFVICVCASLASVGLFTAGASAADCQGTLTKLSECRGDANRNVVIGSEDKCRSVYIDDSLDDYGRITVDTNGAMCVRDADLKGQTIHLYVRDIMVKGMLQIGSKDAPIGRSNPANNVRVMFQGEAPKTPHDAAHSMQDDPPCLDSFQKGLQLCGGGVLRLFGNTGAPPADSQRVGAGKVSWTYLSQPAGDPCRFGPDSGAGGPVTNEGCSVWPGGRTLNLADAVDWRVDDWIAIGTTSFSPFETEFNRIKQIDSTRKVVVLEYPLSYYHFGGPDPEGKYDAGRDKNWGVDERAEVGLISRNIELRGRQSGSPDDHWGGETIIRKTFKEASIQGVEFAFMGKPQLGSYPAHFHQVGRIDTSPGKQTVLFNANSIHHSYNKCITVHSTQNLVLQNNVCARAVGHLFYQEVGDEEDITFQYNLGLGAMSHNFDIHAQREVTYNFKPITAITRANPGKVTATAHGYNNGDTIYVSGVAGMTQVNDQSFTIAKVDENNFTIGVNTTAYTAYSSGGTANGFLPVPEPQQRYQLIEKYWWPGDHMARLYGPGENYFGLNVPNHDNQLNPTHGACRDPLPTGDLSAGWYPSQGNTCKPTQYSEPASGFWIVNPVTKLIGNSIGGCQGVGRAYWYVPPKTASNTGKPDLVDLKFKPIGEFRSNRAHSCYAGLYVEPENFVASEQLQPHQGGTREGASVFNVVDGFTVTRMRDRGIWLRPSFWVVKNARLATNRDSVSLVTAGGVDGTAPGNWALLKDSVLVGISLNNVDRFGPCPYLGVTGPQSSGERGCIDQTPFDRGRVVPGSGGDDVGRGYPPANRNFFGLMIYDGPGRYFHNRFVNFNRDITPYLAAADQAVLGWFKANYANPEAPAPDLNTPGTFVYEGDAALGWFNANQSSYPNTQASEGLEFENVDLRHQIYTERVGIDKFNDGDKNTLILDRDGSLTGMKVVGPDKKAVGNVFPASLNNLPFNASSNSVDECHSTGAQNTLLEGRPTSLISPSPMATLEFSSLFPKALQSDQKSWRYEQWLAFAKTTPDEYPDPVNPGKTLTIYDQMKLHGRNGLGVWEPKVSNGYGYTVTAVDPYNGGDKPAPPGQEVGIPATFNVGLTDAILTTDPETHKVTKPFHVRLAICFTGKNGKHPQPKSDINKMFHITRGYKAYGSPTSNGPTLVEKDVWREIKDCFNLDSQNPGNVAGCPAKTVPVPVGGQCPDGEAPVDGACPTKALTAAADIGSWEKNENSWYYDKSSGYLYLHLLQKVDNGNPKGPLSSPSPTGSCDPAKGSLPAECPNASKIPENYYFCPAGGCIAYGVKLDANEVPEPYVPGQSTCQTLSASPPSDVNLLIDRGTETVLVRDPQVAKPKLARQGDIFPHDALKNGDESKMCPNPGAQMQPPWGPYPNSAPETQSFQVNFDPTLKIHIEEALQLGVTPAMFLANPGNLVVPSLKKGTAYTIRVSDLDKTCTATFVPDGRRDKPTFKRQQGSGNCIPLDGGGTIFATPPQ
jgi:Ubiquitin-activating enzyme E1 FCCH domain